MFRCKFCCCILYRFIQFKILYNFNYCFLYVYFSISSFALFIAVIGRLKEFVFSFFIIGTAYLVSNKIDIGHEIITVMSPFNYYYEDTFPKKVNYVVLAIFGILFNLFYIWIASHHHLPIVRFLYSK